MQLRSIRRARRWLSALALALIITIIGAGLAMASAIATSVIDTTAPTGSVSLSAGDSGVIKFSFTVTGNQAGTCTVSFPTAWTLSGGSFSGTGSSGFSVPAQAGGDTNTFGPFDGTINVAASQSAGGPFTLSVSASVNCPYPTGAKLAVGAASSYAVTVLAPADSTPPVIVPHVSGTLGNNGWYTSDVAVTWSVTDAQSAITSQSGCGPTNVTSDTTGITFTCSATSSGGTASQSVTVKRDATAPTMIATLDPAANEAGWNNSDVTVSFVCQDAMSGIDASYGCPADEPLSGSAHYELHKSTADLAGNVITPTFVVDIDAELPTISGSASPAPNGDGWNNTNVTVHFECIDSRSGIKSCTADETISTEGAGQSRTGTAVDNAGNANTATVNGINIDKTDPEIAFEGQSPAAKAGWNNTDVTLSWNCSDLLSGPRSATVTQTLGEGADQSATGTCSDKADNTADDTQQGINVDETPPIITFASRTAANTNGWNDGPVTVTWTCEDDLSGAVEDSVMDVVTTEGANQTASATCADLAGNTASDTIGGINIDATKPTISGQRSPAANADGWNNGDVVVFFTCEDNASGSGIATDTVAGSTLVDEGVDQAVTSAGDCVDQAGNAADAATVSGISIDRSAPVIADDGPTTGPDGANGWYVGAVTNQFSADGSIAGLADAGDAAFTQSSGGSQGASVTIPSGPVSDKAGNTNPGISSTSFMIDLGDPTVTCAATAPVFTLHQAGATVYAGVSDAVSGPASSVVAASADTSSIGLHSVGVTGQDVAGRTTTVTCSYGVVFDFRGFLKPVDNLPILNTVKAGSAVPVKFGLDGYQGLGVFSSGSPASKVVACDAAAGTDAIETTVTAGASSLQYDAATDTYTYVWKTDKAWAGTCRQLQVRFADGTSHAANFKLTK